MFALRFAGYFLGLYSLYWLATPWVSHYHTLLSWGICTMLDGYWPTLTCVGVELFYEERLILWIVASCDGMGLLLPVGAAVLAQSLGWRERLWGLLLLLPSLWALNFLRLVGLTALRLTTDLAVFDVVHLYVLQPLLVLMALGGYEVWRHTAKNDTANTGPLSESTR